MWIDEETEAQPRVPLSRRRVLRTAVAIADEHGVESLTMRRLAAELGVEPMSLYHHVANKEAILDGLIEVVVGEILAAVEEAAGPDPADDWRGALRTRILTARQVLLRHRWAPAVFQTRTSIALPTVAYYDGVLGILRAGGFSWDLAHHALHALGSRALGFAQELFQPDEAGGDDPEMMAQMAERFPNLAGMMAAIVHDDPDTTLSWCDDQAEFEFGLDVLLDGLERRRTA
ncbi:TetR/AcrR family transcriptional regulator C-terminal domain-containing protein [Thermoactinospora rubra]|uniref:TetR/AcrR family transcriptional regulator C-terminal domain-containing protein n=1 Tax=Thermoactinospora rubra TaxID=1088767 RepID=UPI000A10EFDA|nr:TetR/AcrR family transcriptional regulator C-terminal domain-containing protein [Thermoactinospora rubra]